MLILNNPASEGQGYQAIEAGASVLNQGQASREGWQIMSGAGGTRVRGEVAGVQKRLPRQTREKTNPKRTPFGREVGLGSPRAHG